MVVYNVCKDWEWTQISVASFRRHFPDHTLVVVDHNDNPAERAYLLGQGAVVLSSGPSTTHGAGMNRAAYWCAQNGYDVIVHIEPDCLISGREWYDRLLEPLEAGQWMAAPNRMPFGALHPCPSAWVINKVVGELPLP